MMLTAAQHKLRRRTIGASEISAIAEVNRFKGAVDVFASKARGVDGEIPPMVEEPPPEPDSPLAVAGRIDTSPAELGSLLEDALLGAYSVRTGHEVERWQDSLIHPDEPWASCTPDGRVLVANDNEQGGLEAKLVGRWLRGDWPNDGFPEYVVCQCQWSMWITGLAWWDVVALIDGTSLRIGRIHRDDSLIGDLVDLGRSFWHENILADVMPVARDGGAAMKILAQRWRQDNGMVETPLGDKAKLVEGLARELVLSQDVERAAKAETKRLKALLCAATGTNKAIAGDWGHFDWPTQMGSPRWSDVADDLAHGVVPLDVIEKHRGDAYRKAHFFPRKDWKARVLKEAANG